MLKIEENTYICNSLGLETGSFLLSGKKNHHSAGHGVANINARVCERQSEFDLIREQAANIQNTRC